MKILIGEDDPVTQRLLEFHLRQWGYDVTCVNRGDQALEILLGESPPNLALLDWMMPEVDGVSACKQVRAKKTEPYIYIVLLSSRAEQDDVVAGLHAGADDYIVKPFSAPELEARMRCGKRIIELQSDLIAARERIVHDSEHDPLTGLLNRGGVHKHLIREMSRASREGLYVTVAMIDLDHFKRVNDSHGHDAGDIVLQEAAKRFLDVLRPYDSLGRQGGEEFLAVLPGCDVREGRAAVNRLRERLAATAIAIHENVVLNITCSVGLAAYGGARCEPVQPAQLLKAADVALYRAKELGRNRVES